MIIVIVTITGRQRAERRQDGAPRPPGDRPGGGEAERPSGGITIYIYIYIYTYICRERERECEREINKYIDVGETVGAC